MLLNSRYGTQRLKLRLAKFFAPLLNKNRFSKKRSGKFAITTLLAVSVNLAHGDAFETGLSAYKQDDFVTAFKQWQPLAEAGNAKAMHSLASLYITGKGTERNFDQAYAWFDKAANAGVLQAQYNIAFMLYKGQGIAVDKSGAEYWFKTAADSGLKQAQFFHGMLLEERFDKSQNSKLLDEAISRYRQASLQQHPEALNRLRLWASNEERPLDERSTDMSIWLAAQPNDFYVAQLTTVGAKEGVDTYYKSLTAAQKQGPVMTVARDIDGDIQYSVILGPFDKRQKLNQWLKQSGFMRMRNKPWVRNLKALKSSLKTG